MNSFLFFLLKPVLPPTSSSKSKLLQDITQEAFQVLKVTMKQGAPVAVYTYRKTTQSCSSQVGGRGDGHK